MASLSPLKGLVLFMLLLHGELPLRTNPVGVPRRGRARHRRRLRCGAACEGVGEGGGVEDRAGRSGHVGEHFPDQAGLLAGAIGAAANTLRRSMPSPGPTFPRARQSRIS